MKRLRLLALLAGGLMLGTATAQEDAKADLVRFKGTWALIKFDKGKDAPPEKSSMTIRFVFDEERLTVLRDGKTVDETTFTIDASKTPKTINIVSSQGPHKGKSAEGIYSLKDDTLIICMPPPGKPRPTEFKSDPATKTSVLTLKRASP
ncbi:MAG TPA: TIGR03067 domain-containing protein [Gemmataceae bacterium]|nr:TIGR03067 domain-containing protein [Gemmataceae bacterium]